MGLGFAGGAFTGVAFFIEGAEIIGFLKFHTHYLFNSSFISAMMLDIDRRTSKYEVEQQKRREEARKRKEREDKAALAQRQREAELAERAARKKEEQEEALEARRIAEELENQLTGGVKFNMSLIPYHTDAADDDKIILPEEALTSLTQQDVFGQRPALFRLTLTLPDGAERRTHCGVREFSAPPGHMGLTTKVLASLGLSSADMSQPRTVSVKYVLLPKITYAQLEMDAKFSLDMPNIKRVLEENLNLHTTLSCGDVVTVWYRGVSYVLKVTELKPDNTGGSLIDTDVEVDLRTAGYGGTAGAGKTALDSDVASSRISTVAAPSTPANPPSSSSVVPQCLLNGRLEDEPSSDREGGVVKIKFKLPKGDVVIRLFSLASPLQQVFLFLYSTLAPSLAPSTSLSALAFSRRMPPRTWSLEEASCAMSIGESGLGPQAESLFVKL
eukprot:gene26368-31856_t